MCCGACVLHASVYTVCCVCCVYSVLRVCCMCDVCAARLLLRAAVEVRHAPDIRLSRWSRPALHVIARAQSCCYARSLMAADVEHVGRGLHTARIDFHRHVCGATRVPLT